MVIETWKDFLIVPKIFYCSHELVFQTNRNSVMETLCAHLHISRRDLLGHVASSLQVEMARHDWLEEDMKYFVFQVIKEKKITTNLDGKQMLTDQSTRYFSSNLVLRARSIQWKHL